MLQCKLCATPPPKKTIFVYDVRTAVHNNSITDILRRCKRAKLLNFSKYINFEILL